MHGGDAAHALGRVLGGGHGNEVPDPHTDDAALGLVLHLARDCLPVGRLGEERVHGQSTAAQAKSATARQEKGHGARANRWAGYEPPPRVLPPITYTHPHPTGVKPQAARRAKGPQANLPL